MRFPLSFSRPRINPRSFSVLIGLAATVLLAGSLTGCTPSANQQPVVTINKTITVSRGDYEKLTGQLMKEANLDPKQFNESSPQQGVLAEQIKQAVLNKLIFSALLKDSAKKQNITVSDKEYQAFRAKQVEPLGGDDGLKKVLASKNMSIEAFEESMHEQALIEKFFDAQPDSKTNISDQEAQAFYQSHPELFRHSEGRDMAHILLRVDPMAIRAELSKANPTISDADVAQRVEDLNKLKKAKAEEILAAVTKDPKSFGVLAKTLSQDVLSAIKGGELGTMYADTTVPEFWKAALQTPAGTTYPGVIQSPFGFHIVHVNRVVPAGLEPFATAKEDIIRVLGQQRRQQAMMVWMEAQRKTLKLNFTKGFVPMGYRQPADSDTAQPKPATH